MELHCSPFHDSSALYPVVTAILARIFLHERLHAMRIAGVVLAIVGGLHIAVIGLIVGLVAVGYIVLALVSSALSSIYSAALYRFATTGQAGMFDRGLLANAFRNR